MRRLRTIALVSAVVLAIVAGIVIALRQPGTEVKLADGSILRVEKVAFGKRESVTVTAGSMWKRLKDSMAAHLPKSLASRIVSTSSTNKSNWRGTFSTPHSNLSTLNVWLTRHNASTGSYLSVDVRNAEIVDEDGCVFGATTYGGEDNGVLPAPTPAARPASASGFFGTGTTGITLGNPGMRSSVTWFCFEVFPRRDKLFKLRFYDEQRKLLAEFMAPNPGPVPPAVPAAPLVPVSATNGPITFTLTAAGMRTNPPTRVVVGNMGPADSLLRDTMLSNYREAWFKLQVTEVGVVSEDWEPVTMELTDGSGNLAPVRAGVPVPLCPREPVWKLAVNFASRAGSSIASNSMWTLTNIVIPAPGTAKSLEGGFELQELSFRLVAIGGPGSFKYQNGVVVEATPLPGGGGVRGVGGGGGSSTSSTSQSSQTLRSPTPHVAVVIQGKLATNHWLTVAVKDDQGRQTFARSGPGTFTFTPVSSGRGSSPNRQPQYLGQNARSSRGPIAASASPVTIFSLDLDKDAISVDLTFCLHTPVTAQFEFKPEGIAAHPNQ
jgi:hypothetical protein